MNGSLQCMRGHVGNATTSLLLVVDVSDAVLDFRPETSALSPEPLNSRCYLREFSVNSWDFFRLQLFGRPSITATGGDSAKEIAVQRRRVALLAILALAEERGLSRDKILGLLWPENDTERARNLLNVAVYALRKVLGDEAIISDGDGLRLNSRVIQSDVADFESAVARDEAATAVALHAAPFLDGFFITDAPEFERWVERERDRLGRLYCGLIEKLADQSEREGDFDHAAEWWKSRASYDPYDSRVTLRLIHALDAAGNTAAALQQAQIHARLLKQDFGVEPPADLKSATEALRTRRETIPENRIVRYEAVQPPPTVDTDSPDQALVNAAAATTPISIEASRSPAVSQRRSRKTTTWISASLLILAAVGGLAFISARTGKESTAPAPAATIQPVRSIAVLPFANMSPGPDEEYFADGLAEELISTLSHVSSLHVASRTSAFAFKGQNRDIRSIGKLLNVRTVLEGSVRKVGNRVRVTAQLINSSDGFHLWSETFEREGTDIFAIQADLALRITNALEAELTPEERKRIARPPTENPQAHTLYLQALYFAGQRRSGSLAKAIEYYRRAIAADPQYAAAYAGLASVYPPLGVLGFISASEGRTLMREPATKAVALDPGLASAHTALGGYMYAYEWNWTAAEREFKKAIELDPSESHGWYSVYLLAMRRNDEAIREARLGAEVSPLSAISFSQFGYTLICAGRPDLALAPLNTAVELDSGLSNAHLQLAFAYEALGKREQALRKYEKAAALVPGKVVESAYLGRAFAHEGKKKEAREILDSLKAITQRTRIYTPQVALLIDELEARDSAIAWLELSASQRHPAFPHSVAEPAFASLRRDPRMHAILQRYGLPP
jgi:TolB-like protein/DNA-binding SARP family transcriptional activator/Tfp pilus assembly protein PilF